MIIRALDRKDPPHWERLWFEYLAFYESAVPDEVTAATFERLLDPQEPMFSYVAVRDDQLVGLVQCVLHRATWTTAHYCYLEDLLYKTRTVALALAER
jgi:hypothetical protein